MKRVSGITAYSAVLFLVLALMLAWTGGQAALAGTLTWTDTGATGGSYVSSLAWNGTTLYAGCGDGHVYSKTGTGSWIDTGATGGTGYGVNVNSLAWNGTDTLYAGCGDGHVYSKTGAGSWTDTGATGGGYVNSLAWNGTDTLYAGCDDGHVYSKTGAGSWTDTGATGGGYVNSLAWNGTDTLYAGCDRRPRLLEDRSRLLDRHRGHRGWSMSSSLAWNGTDTLYAGCGNGHALLRRPERAGTPGPTPVLTGGSWVNSLAWNGTDTLYAGCDDGHVYSKTGTGSWTDTGATGGTGYGVDSLAWNGTDTLYAGCGDGVFSGVTNGVTTHTITASYGPNGTISPSGAVTVNDGADKAFTITANAGYHINTLTVDGAPVTPVTTYTFHTVTTDHTIAVTFAMTTHTITASYGPNGTISPSGPVTVNDGADKAFTITANAGYHINTLTVDGAPVTPVTTYTFHTVTTDHTIAVTFAMTTHTITASYGPNGTISPSGPVTVNDGADKAFTITANAGYHINTLTVDGAPVTPVTTYTFHTVTTDHTIAVTFAMTTHTITASYGPNGTISPSGAVTVNDGADKAFTITANAGYHINTLTVDGAPVTPVTTYTFHTVTTDHTIAVTFAMTTHTITASYGPNGTISPSGAVTVNDGADKAFTITANAGYHINTLTVDGAPVTPATTYTFHSVTTDHTILVNFTINLKPLITSIFPLYGPLGSIVTIIGDNFGDIRGASSREGAGSGSAGKSSGAERTAAGASYVSFNGVPATEYPLWTNTKIQAVVPDGASAGPITVTTSAGSSPTTKTFTVSYPTWYLAEGSTDWGYDCYITIENPNTTSVNVKLTYQTKSGEVAGPQFAMAASSQATVNPRETIGNTDFSTKVECTDGKTIAADRTMTWTGPGAASPEAHNSIGVTSPATTWYLAEGLLRLGIRVLAAHPEPERQRGHLHGHLHDRGLRTPDRHQDGARQLPCHLQHGRRHQGAKDASIKVDIQRPGHPGEGHVPQQHAERATTP